MQPLNIAERKKAFRNFLIFFSITTALVITTILFSVQVPFKENEQLTEQMKVCDKEREFGQRFVTQMSETMNLLDSINKNEIQSPEIIDNKIQTNVGIMSAMIESDSISEKSMYRFIINNLTELRLARKDLRNVSGKDANLTALQKENAELRNNYQQAVDRYAQCQNMLILQQRQ